MVNRLKSHHPEKLNQTGSPTCLKTTVAVRGQVCRRGWDAQLRASLHGPICSSHRNQGNCEQRLSSQARFQTPAATRLMAMSTTLPAAFRVMGRIPLRVCFVRAAMSSVLGVDPATNLGPGLELAIGRSDDVVVLRLLGAAISGRTLQQVD